MAKITDKPNRLGEMLVEANLITRPQLEKALSYQQTTSGRLGEILEKLGFIKEEALLNFLAEQQDLQMVDTEEVIWPEALIKKIPQSLIEKYTFLPISKQGDVLKIAINDPTDYDAIEEIQLFTNMRVEVALAPRNALKKAIAEIFNKSRTGVITKEDLINELDKISSPQEGKQSEGIKTSGEIPVSSVLKALVHILIEKNIITEKELNQKINEVNL